MPASDIDVTAPFDPTAYSSLTFAQLFQLVSGLAPYLDKGLVVTTEDVGGNPEVPDAVSEPKFARYMWRRITATTTSVYVWDPNHASDATYLRWVSITVAGIAVGSIVNAMIADNTITDIKIANLDYSKLINAPTGLSPSGAAGGDLTGTYPNPSIGVAKVTGSQIANTTITHANLAANAVQVPTDILPSAVQLSLIRTNAGATALEYFVPQVITLLTNPAGAADVGKLVSVNAAGNAFELSTTGAIVQRLAKLIAGNIDITAVTPIDNTIPVGITEGDLIATLAITPKNVNNLIRVTFTVWANSDVAGGYVVMFLAKTGSPNSIQTVAKVNSDNGEVNALHLDYVMTAGVLTAITFNVYAGVSSGNGYVNKGQAVQLFSTTAQSYLIIEEFQGTLS